MDGLLLVMGKSGFLLFTLGLLLGLGLPKMRNPRMGLSAHLTAAQTGLALIAFAVFWPYLAVPPAWSSWLVWALILSSYILVLGITLAAIFGASTALPIAGKGYNASQIHERIVSVLVRGSSVIMLISCLVICYFALMGR